MMKYAFFLFCVLTVYAVVDVEAQGANLLGNCYCHYGRGHFCGSTKRIGQLSGDCSENDLYYCPGGHNSVSHWKGFCSNGCYAATGGKDYCK